METNSARDGRWEFVLYVAGQTPTDVAAFINLKAICEEHLAGSYSIEVIDLLERPGPPGGERVLAIPTLVRTSPRPSRKLYGDLSNTERVLTDLNLPDAASG